MSDEQADWVDAHVVSRQYLSLPSDYVQALGGLRWSDKSNQLVFPNDEPVASLENLAEFLEGFAAQRPLLAFGSMAHWVVLLNTSSADHEFDRLRTAFQASDTNWRNAGALAGMMSELLLPAQNPPPVAIVSARLREQAFPIRWFTGMLNARSNKAEDPPHSIVEFEQHVRKGMVLLSDDDLAAWLKFGRGPVHSAGKSLARVQPPPRLVGSILEELFERPRLAGAAAYVPQMVMALSVPPRRQEPEQLPMGGYVDVVTHGSVDRLLPSQHALDDLEFLRRFSANELLYFRREEPPAQHRQEVVVVLDQGVRTWGDVRLVLTAAALALLQHADRKKMDCRLACTSRPGGFVNPLGEADPHFGTVLEASDFTRNPGLALEGVLEWPCPVARDIVLLTHPFSLKEADVQIAARRLLPQDRLFALTINAQGNAELVQLRNGLPVRLRSFRVDFAPAKTSAALPLAAAPTWTGDVESVRWPFRFGTDSPIRLFDFDAAGQRLLVVTASDMLYSWNLIDGDLEILPRPQLQQRRVTDWKDIVGVEGGFALLGVVDSRYVVAHYDWKSRKCVVHKINSHIISSVCLAFVRHCDSVVLIHQPRELPFVAVDLATGAFAGGSSFDLIPDRGFQAIVHVGLMHLEATQGQHAADRAQRAINHIETVGPTPGILATFSKTEFASRIKRPGYCFEPHEGMLFAFDGSCFWKTLEPRNDGKKSFVKARIHEVRLAASTLAVHYQPAPISEDMRLLAFFRGPDGHFLRETRWVSSKINTRWPFRLSNDGGKVALLRHDQQLEVQWTDRPERILLTRPGGFGTKCRLWVGDGGLLLACGRKGFAWHLLQWSQGVLEVSTEMKASVEMSYQEFHHPRIKDFISNADPEEAVVVATKNFEDPERRARSIEAGGALFVLDRLGQVLIFDSKTNLVFEFFAHGDSWSAWMPDGTRHGRGMVHTWPNTPNALMAIGQALRSATGGGRP